MRKKYLKEEAFNPDSLHLHQLLFYLVSKKFKINKKIISNNITSIIINFYNIIIFSIGFNYYTKTNVQILLIFLNIFFYVIVYILTLKYKKNQ